MINDATLRSRYVFVSHVSRLLPIALLLIVGLGISQQAIAQGNDLTLSLIDARLETVRNSDASNTDQLLQVYEAARTRLAEAASFERYTARYVDALINAPRLEAEIQARIDEFDKNKVASVEVAGLPRDELEAALALTLSELDELENSLDSHERQLAGREAQSDLLRTRVNEISERIGDIDEVVLSIVPDAIPTMAEAVSWSAAAEHKALVAERQSNEAQLNSQRVRYAVLRAEREELSLLVGRLSGQVRLLEEVMRRDFVDEVVLDDFRLDDDARTAEGGIAVESGARWRTLPGGY